MNPTTPVRQIPGAFINTPAPGPNTARRRLNFNDVAGPGTTGATGNTPAPITSTLGTGQPEIATGMMPQPPLSEDLPPIAKAAQVVNQTLQLDESYPDLDSYCRRISPLNPILHLAI
jgi:nuclear pore complex protein Nup155